MTVLWLVPVLVAAVLTLALPNERDNWRLARLLDRLERDAINQESTDGSVRL